MVSHLPPPTTIEGLLPESLGQKLAKAGSAGAGVIQQLIVSCP